MTLAVDIKHRLRHCAARTERVVDLLGLGSLLDRRPGRLSGGESVALDRRSLSGPRGPAPMPIPTSFEIAASRRALSKLPLHLTNSRD